MVVSLCVSKARSVKYASDWAFQFLFFTVWNYCLQAVFWACAACASALTFCSTTGPSAALRRAVHHLVSICVPMSLLVSVVLWCVLAPDALQHHHPSQVFNFYSYNMHAANTLCLLAEFASDRMLLKPGTLVLVLSWTLAYAIFVWVQHTATHFWPYFFLRLDTYAALGWYAALVVLVALAFGVARGLSALKARRDPELVELELDAAASEGFIGESRVTARR